MKFLCVRRVLRVDAFGGRAPSIDHDSPFTSDMGHQVIGHNSGAVAKGLDYCRFIPTLGG